MHSGTKGYFVWSVTFKSGSSSSRGELDLKTCQGKIGAFAMDCMASAKITDPDGMPLVSMVFGEAAAEVYTLEAFAADLKCYSERFVADNKRWQQELVELITKADALDKAAVDAMCNECDNAIKMALLV